MSTWTFNSVELLRFNAAQLAEFLQYPNLESFEAGRRDGMIPEPDGEAFGESYWNRKTAIALKLAQIDAIRQAWGYEPEGGE